MSRTLSLHASAILALSLICVPTTARATCSAAAPLGFREADCNDICTEVNPTNHDWECILDTGSGISPTMLHACTPSSSGFLAYGSDSDGNDFCCEDTRSVEVRYVTVSGTYKVDEIHLHCDETSEALDADYGFVYGWPRLSASGEDGGDDLRGSQDSACIDYIWGGDDNDTLMGGAGDDFLYGGDAQDTIYAGSGDDFVEGGNGDDYIYGEAGSDVLYGDLLSGGEDCGDCYDHIKGGTGYDELYGGKGDDNLCGEADTDILRGGDGNDTLNGGGGLYDNADGNGGNNLCTAETETNCAAGDYDPCDW